MLLVTLLQARPAAAQEFRFHAEPAVAIWLDEPQMSRYTPGLYLALRPGIALGQVVALQWSYALLAVGPGKNYDDNGSAHFLTAGIRLRPFATLRPTEEQLGGLYVDFNVGYVRTEELNRFGFDTGIGYGFQVSSVFSLGPAVRYGQIVQPKEIPNRDENDAQFLTVGIDFAFGPAYEAKREYTCPPASVMVEKEEPAEVAAVPCLPCPDEDQDGVCDVDDLCPKEIGPPASFGCPIDPCKGPPPMVLVQFEFSSSDMPAKKAGAQTMDPVLDAVAAAISKDPSCRVCIMGHASKEGPADFNQTLSSERAKAVQNYMISHGISQSRIPSIGMGEKCQLIPESTYVFNRRVEFRRLKDGESCPTDCARR
jgi:hypothetical protein